MTHRSEQFATKIPKVTLVFWIIKIAATTLGENGGDTVSMTMNWGYLVGTAIFVTRLAVLVVVSQHKLLVSPLRRERCKATATAVQLPVQFA
jgi:uncharacterized membrane-anchored protein